MTFFQARRHRGLLSETNRRTKVNFVDSSCLHGEIDRYIPYLLVNTYVCRSTTALPLSLFRFIYQLCLIGECGRVHIYAMRGLDDAKRPVPGKALTTRKNIRGRMADDATFLFGLLTTSVSISAFDMTLQYD